MHSGRTVWVIFAPTFLGTKLVTAGHFFTAKESRFFCLRREKEKKANSEEKKGHTKEPQKSDFLNTDEPIVKKKKLLYLSYKLVEQQICEANTKRAQILLSNLGKSMER